MAESEIQYLNYGDGSMYKVVVSFDTDYGGPRNDIIFVISDSVNGNEHEAFVHGLQQSVKRIMSIMANSYVCINTSPYSQ